jgi:tetratricopeptide (TPR) repeat protein
MGVGRSTGQPGNTFDLLEKAEELRRRGQLQDALALYDDAVVSRPGYYFAYFRRAALLQDMGQNEKALIDLDECIRLRPGDVDVLRARVALLEAMGEYELAVMEQSRIPKTAGAAPLPRSLIDVGDDDGNDCGVDGVPSKYRAQYDDVRGAMQKRHQRKLMVAGRRGHYVQSDRDRVEVERRQQFKKNVSALERGPGTSQGYQRVQTF